MRRSESCTAITVALVSLHAEMLPVVKDRSNSHVGNKYATLDAIMEYLRPLAAKHGIIVSQTAERSEGGLLIETTALHTSGEWIGNSVFIPLLGQQLKGGGYGPVSPQSVGSALTYGRRYGLSSLFAMTTEEDDDGNAASRQRKEARAEAVKSTAPKVVQEANAKKTTSLASLTFPKLKGFEEFEGKPFLEVPSDVFARAITMLSSYASKNAKAMVRGMTEYLEQRAIWEEESPALKPGPDEFQLEAQ